jgi:hypothetical protein
VVHLHVGRLQHVGGIRAERPADHGLDALLHNELGGLDARPACRADGRVGQDLLLAAFGIHNGESRRPPEAWIERGVGFGGGNTDSDFHFVTSLQLIY